MENSRTVLCIVAHPDDAEFLCAGTLALLAEKGWEIVTASMTPGQAGSAELGPEEISAIRRKEAAKSASMLNGKYYCLESEDLFIAYDKPTLLKATELFRLVRPSMVFTHSPTAYIIDHETTSRITQTACIAACVPNIVCGGVPVLDKIPVLYYSDPIEGKDIFGKRVQPDFFVDITHTMQLKEEMLCCHKSQREWLHNIFNVDEFVNMMKGFAKRNGEQAGCEYAEGFRQHLGFSFPHENVLMSELDRLLITV